MKSTRWFKRSARIFGVLAFAWIATGFVDAQGGGDARTSANPCRGLKKVYDRFAGTSTITFPEYEIKPGQLRDVGNQRGQQRDGETRGRPRAGSLGGLLTPPGSRREGSERMMFSVAATIDGRGVLTPSREAKEAARRAGVTSTATIDLSFLSVSPAQKFFHLVEAVFLVDGTRRIDKGRVLVGHSDRASQTGVEGRYATAQRMDVAINLAELRELAAAESVELRLGPTEIVFGQSELTSVKRFLQCLEEGAR